MSYIYIFQNTLSRELIKVGKTQYRPSIRAEQLSKQTGVIGKFEVIWYLKVPDCTLAEKMAHYLLRNSLYQKEFFKIDSNKALRLIYPKLDHFFHFEDDGFDSTLNGQVLQDREDAYKKIFYEEDFASIEKRLLALDKFKRAAVRARRLLEEESRTKSGF